MPQLTFEWDKEKNGLNQRKHGISFEEAQTVFVDEHALLIHAPDHSGDEDRFVLLGLSAKLRIALVTVIEKAMRSLESYLPERQPVWNRNNTGRGDEHEKGIRFF